MAESFLFYSVHQSHTTVDAMRMFEYLLECVQHPDYEVCLSISLANVLSRLFSLLTSHSMCGTDSLNTCSNSMNQQ